MPLLAFGTDYTAPVVERSFNIMLRAGALLPIPEVLQGRGVRFEYQSPIKRLRQQIEAAAARAWVEELLAIDAERPDAFDRASDLVNFDAHGRFSAESAGLPHQIVNGTDRVGEIRQARAEAQATAAEAEELRAGVETASTVTNMPGGKDALKGAVGKETA